MNTEEKQIERLSDEEMAAILKQVIEDFTALMNNPLPLDIRIYRRLFHTSLAIIKKTQKPLSLPKHHPLRYSLSQILNKLRSYEKYLQENLLKPLNEITLELAMRNPFLPIVAMKANDPELYRSNLTYLKFSGLKFEESHQKALLSKKMGSLAYNVTQAAKNIAFLGQKRLFSKNEDYRTQCENILFRHGMSYEDATIYLHHAQFVFSKKRRPSQSLPPRFSPKVTRLTDRPEAWRKRQKPQH